MGEKCYIISYQLSSSTNLAELHKAIKDYGAWARITSDTWAIVTPQSAVSVRNKLKSHLQSSDRIFVVKSGLEAAWNNVICSNEWLKKNL